MASEEEHIITLLTAENNHNLLLSLALLKANPYLLSAKVKELLVYLHYRGGMCVEGAEKVTVQKKIELVNLKEDWALNLCQYYYATDWLKEYLGDIDAKPIRGTRNELLQNSVFFHYFNGIAIFPELFESKFKHKKEYLDCLYQAIHQKMIFDNNYWRLKEVKENYPLFIAALNAWKLDSMPVYKDKPAYLEDNYDAKFENLIFKYSKTPSELLVIISRMNYWVEMQGDDHYINTVAQRTKNLNTNEQEPIIKHLNLRIKGLNSNLKMLKKKQLILDLEGELKFVGLTDTIKGQELELQRIERLLVEIMSTN